MIELFWFEQYDTLEPAGSRVQADDERQVGSVQALRWHCRVRSERPRRL